MNTPSFVVCIPAAGSGSRMNSGMPKQYIRLAGKPVLCHTLAVFDAMDACEKIVIATDDPEQVSDLLADYPLRTPVTIVPGGAVRQQSVSNALGACGDDATIVLIHDAARPCISTADIKNVAVAVAEHGAAFLAVPARDTIKRVKDGVVQKTLDRERIWMAQTPQGARAGLLRKAFANAVIEVFTGTDDMELLERIHVSVHVVCGSPSNIKITSPEDLPLAEMYLTLQ